MSKDFDIAVIGSGPGGYVAALKAAQLGAKVAVIEKHHLGGTCLNYGCIPSKALLASAELLYKINGASSLGVSVSGQVNFDWPSIQKRKDTVLKTLRGGIKGLFGSRKVTLFEGKGTIAGDGKIKITKQNGSEESISAAKTIIAVGSVPTRIPGWPEDPQLVCTSDEALHWDKPPQSLLIIGGGVIGCEFACMMREYGVEVTVVEMLPNLLPEMETQLGLSLAEIFTKRGIDCITSTKVEELTTSANKITAKLSGGRTIEADKVLVAIGRKPNTADLGLDKIGLDTDRGFISVNEKMETKVKGYFCIGDANGRCLLAHAASEQGVIAVENALGHKRKYTAPIPGAVYTFPEVASVGLTSKQAREKDIPVSVGTFPIGHLGKAMAVGKTEGFVKVIRSREDEKLLGVHMIGHNATEIIAAATVLLGQKVSAKEMAETVFAHPTISESLKESAEDSFGAALHLPPRKIVRVVTGE